MDARWQRIPSIQSLNGAPASRPFRTAVSGAQRERAELLSWNKPGGAESAFRFPLWGKVAERVASCARGSGLRSLQLTTSSPLQLIAALFEMCYTPPHCNHNCPTKSLAALTSPTLD